MYFKHAKGKKKEKRIFPQFFPLLLKLRNMDSKKSIYEQDGGKYEGLIPSFETNIL